MIVKDFFIALSENQLLNRTAQKYGLKMGAQTVVAGTNIDETIESIKELNKYGISCTVDNLGEFVSDKDEAVKAKNQILQVIEAIYENKVDAHISLKPSQLGLDIDLDFCRDNLLEIFEAAAKYDIFINIDMENHSRLQPSFDLVDQISEKYDNIGTVIQAYFHRAENDIQKYKNYRLRIVKGAYKEPAELAYQTKAEIDKNYINLIEYHLLNGKFTSIATHDHKVINHVKQFVKDHQIPNEKFEFQMLYGFRFDMQMELAKEGYQFCTYVPFGTDWYGYFMRRLAERPQNISLVTKQVFTKKTNTALAIAAGAFLLGRLSKRKK
ncbi:proline dehydrogenase [Pradoshia sp. D12]|uniref:proline dehydrogenase family protein n=1 Tax=Bacillaceae TaxID=186817 RepID=UPI00080AC2E5|nr:MULTISPECIES: proline dehydrogenase family protein [Bacillaceae]OCA86235.1 proline dehydrogenase [Bacillus sp. FJAT-27986]QFK72029.1 proline dehydrogenase [Pradoshia sp. D12]TPF71479.1 proline dehydrogenase [Bacillus sp. D12]